MSKFISNGIQSFEDTLKTFKDYVVRDCLHPVLVVSIVSLVVGVLGAMELIIPILKDIERRDGKLSAILKPLRCEICYAYFIGTYVACLFVCFSYKWRQHVPGLRKFPYAFTLIKSLVQVGILLFFTFLDKYLKDRNGLEVVITVASLYLHLITVFFAFAMGEDCDSVNAFFAASFALLYELSKEDWKAITGFTVAAILLMWIKNLLFLPPDDLRKVAKDLKTLDSKLG